MYNTDSEGFYKKGLLKVPVGLSFYIVRLSLSYTTCSLKVNIVHISGSNKVAVF